MEEWKPEEVEAHLDYYRALGRELEESGERVQSEVLAGPDLAKIVTSDGSATVVTDGPFQEFKEWLAGFQIVDVESEERALEIAAQAVGRPRCGRRADPAADPGPAGDGGGAEGRRRDGELPGDRGRRALNVPRRVEDLLRELAPQVLGTLVRRSRRFRRGRGRRPGGADRGGGRSGRGTAFRRSPRGWLLQTAERRLIDQRRSERSRRAAGGARRRGSRAAVEVPDEDDTLTVLFMCCHPALTAGLGDRADAARRRRADDGRDRRRLPRGRGDDGAADQPRQAADHGPRASPFRMPDAGGAAGAGAGGAAGALPDLQRGIREQRGRRAAARRALGGGDPAGADGAAAAARRRRGRRPARADAADRRPPSRPDRRRGELVPLAEQDRSLWERARSKRARRCSNSAMAEGRSASTSSRRRSRPCTTGAATAEETDWPQILALYGLLEQLTGNPVVTLNRAVATAMAERAAGGLAVLDQVGERLARPLPRCTQCARICSRWRATRKALERVPRRRRPCDELT